MSRPVSFIDTSETSDLPWYREVNRDQWRAFLATFYGWVLDGFDFTILTFILIDIQESFTVDKVLAGALGTVTLLFRMVGGLAAGTAADRWGRKLPLMLSILWFSLFAFLSGFSTSYAMLFFFRALFGVGMGVVVGALASLQGVPGEAAQKGQTSVRARVVFGGGHEDGPDDGVVVAEIRIAVAPVAHDGSWRCQRTSFLRSV